MAYTPTNWECGDTITAEKLNKLEEAVANVGGGAEPLILKEVSSSEEGRCTIYAYNATWEEVSRAFHEGRSIWLDSGPAILPLASFGDASLTFYRFVSASSQGIVSLASLILNANESTGVMERTDCGGVN